MPTDALTHWFLGDGGSFRSKKCPSVVVTCFSTHCFSEKEVRHLASILNNMGIRTNKLTKYACEEGSGLQIPLSQSGIDYFMSLIEPSIMEIFGDSVGSSYKDLVKYKDPGHSYTTCIRAGGELDALRRTMRRA